VEVDGEMVHTRDYRTEGRKSFYTDGALSSRHNLRQNNSVLKALQIFFVTFNTGRDNTLDRQEVMDVQVRICKALFAPGEFDLEEAKEAVEEDWDREQGSKMCMNREEFFDSLFETADIWCNKYVSMPRVSIIICMHP
jgi:hypothetical protein